MTGALARLRRLRVETPAASTFETCVFVAPAALRRERPGPLEEISLDTRLRPSQTLLLGSLVFGLFFGAGNLIFPAGLGREAGDAAVAATLGFLITAVGLPVLGIVASARTGANSVYELTAPISRRFATAFTCALYLTIGPLFAIPRTATVSYEIGVRPLLDRGGAGLLVFSALFFAVTAAVSLRPGRLMEWIGRYLTPIFLLLLSVLVVAALIRPMGHDLGPAAEPYASAPVTSGLLDGYNTMDALASLAFAIVVIDAAKRLGVTAPRRLAVELGKAGIIGGLAMAVVYSALAYIGATSVGTSMAADNGGALLAGTAAHHFGTAGGYLIAAIVFVACLKTAIGLTVACSEMFAGLFGGRAGATPGAGGSRAYLGWLVGFVLVSFLVANLGLEAIIGVSVPVLMFLYPIAIVTILLGLAWEHVADRLVIARTVVTFTAIAAFFDLLAALPGSLPESPAVSALTGVAETILPGYASGFGWVVPALVGLVVGIALHAAGRRGRVTEPAGHG